MLVQWNSEALDLPGSGVAGNCELLDVGVGVELLSSAAAAVQALNS